MALHGNKKEGITDSYKLDDSQKHNVNWKLDTKTLREKGEYDSVWFRKIILAEAGNEEELNTKGQGGTFWGW